MSRLRQCARGKLGGALSWVPEVPPLAHPALQANGTAERSQTMSQDRDARFRATVYAMNTLLIQKGVYSQKEFHRLFLEGMCREEMRKP